MSKKTSEIEDNEIRIISLSDRMNRRREKRGMRVWLLVILVLVILVIVLIVSIPKTAEKQQPDEPQELEIRENVDPELPIEVQKDTITDVIGYTLVQDTVINQKGLLLLRPENGCPRLVVGSESLKDTCIILATQAADIRKDNGKIVGSFVLDGELISKGEAKAGFCSIVNGEITIGVADATPMFEQALTDGGYFFRQYPLVVGGQIVENKPKGISIRKALAEIGGRIYVAMSRERLTFHEFSQLLVDAGARNAIYLVGSSSYGFYRNENGEKMLIGKEPNSRLENISYIIWE